jgi:exosortase family protein XrtF
LREIFRKYRPVTWFVLRFLGAYFLLSLLYSFYLQQSQGSAYPPDPITHLVARQSSALLSDMNYNARVLPMTDYPGMILEVEGQAIARIIEGCNAVSIMVLFVAFVVSFRQSFKKTVIFLLSGAAMVYIANVVRIALLAVLMYKYPEQKEWLHGVLFPALIYGMVFLLWMLWVRMLDNERLVK